MDIEKDYPADQGFQSQQFDIVIAANVLHATADLRKTLQHVRKLLRPDGTLLLLEITSRERWIDLSFGMTDGWWKFSDRELRRAHTLLNESDRNATTSEFFGQVSVAASQQTDYVSSVFVAQGLPHAAVQKFLIVPDAGGVSARLAGALNRQGMQCDVLHTDYKLAEALKRLGIRT